jgi:hypothetical protein
VQPASIILQTQSQQAWIISQHFGSPLVHVMQIPSGTISHLHIPMVKLQQQTIMPFHMQQQLQRPPVSIVQRFCTMLHAALSSHMHVIFMPPLIFSILNVQRGTIMYVVGVGMPVGAPMVGVPIPGMPMPGIPIPVRSIIIVLDMWPSPYLEVRGSPSSGLRQLAGIIDRGACEMQRFCRPRAILIRVRAADWRHYETSCWTMEEVIRASRPFGVGLDLHGIGGAFACPIHLDVAARERRKTKWNADAFWRSRPSCDCLVLPPPIPRRPPSCVVPSPSLCGPGNSHFINGRSSRPAK